MISSKKMTNVRIISTTMVGENSVYPQPGDVLSEHVYPFPPSKERPFGFYEGCTQGVVALEGDLTTTIHTGQNEPVNGGEIISESEIVTLKQGETKNIKFKFPRGFEMTLRGEG